jgi:DNA-binding CsgD family transcriptional regulator
MSSPLARVVEPFPPVRDGTGADESATLRGLVEGVLQHARETVTPASNASSQVVLDVEQDGFRCVVLCSAPPGKRRETPLLSPREQEIARMVARGLPNKAIAAVLEISSWTVGTYLRRMFAKLGVTSRAAMIARLMDRD